MRKKAYIRQIGSVKGSLRTQLRLGGRTVWTGNSVGAAAGASALRYARSRAKIINRGSVTQLSGVHGGSLGLPRTFRGRFATSGGSSYSFGVPKGSRIAFGGFRTRRLVLGAALGTATAYGAYRLAKRFGGSQKGHPFYGNQYVQGHGRSRSRRVAARSIRRAR